MLHMKYIFIVKLHFFCNVKKRTKLKMVKKNTHKTAISYD